MAHTYWLSCISLYSSILQLLNRVKRFCGHSVSVEGWVAKLALLGLTWLIKALRNPYRAFCCYSKQISCQKQQTTRYSSILQLLNRSQIYSGHPVPDALPRLDYKVRNGYGICCFPQALNSPPPRSISIKFSITDFRPFSITEELSVILQSGP